MGFYLVLLYLSHITGRQFISSQFFFFFFGLFKNRKHQLLLLFSGLLLKIVICMINNNRGIYNAHVTENYQGLTRILIVLQSQTKRPFSVSTLGVQVMDEAVPALFEKSLVLLWGKLHEHSDEYKKKKKKSFLDINLTLSSSKATGRNRKALCAGLTPVTPLWHVLFLRVTGSGAPRENLSPF